MSANIAEANSTASETAAAATPPAPKRITNAQTVCNERNEKNKLCNGHLKQLKTAGELSEVHLRGDDVLSKCQICGTLYMGPPLGHVRDPEKQSRFVEAELSALLQAAGGTLPVIEKNEKGVYVIVEPGGGGHGHAAPAPAAKPAPAAATPAATPAAPAAPAPAAAPAAAAAPAPAKPTPALTPAASVAEKAMAAPVPKPAGEPNRQLNRRSTYAGVVDTGPVPGETREQKIERLQKVVAGAKQRSDEGGAEHAPAAASVAIADVPEQTEPVVQPATAAPTNATPAPAVAATPAPTTSHASSGEPDRTLLRRSTYAGVVDTGPVPGETHEQKIERLTKLVAAAKQCSEEGGADHAAVTDSSPAADAHRPTAEAQAETGAASAAPLSATPANASPGAAAETPADLAPDKVGPATTPTPTTSPASSGEPDRTLFRRSTYAGVVDTGPVPGETHEQKIERLTRLVAAAKRRSEEGG